MTERNDKPADDQPSRGARIAKGVAVGVGSAALVAALLYASKAARNRSARRRDD